MAETAVAPQTAVVPQTPPLKEEEKLTLAKIELGTDYTAKIDINGFQFKVHYPSMFEDQKILVEQERQFDGVRSPSPELRLTALLWATLDVVVEEIWKVSGEIKPKRLEGPFSIHFKTMRNASLVYGTIVLPLYNKYLEFENKLNSEVDPLKNA